MKITNTVIKALRPAVATVGRRRQLGSFPPAFSHLTLILAAREISAGEADGKRPTP